MKLLQLFLTIVCLVITKPVLADHHIDLSDVGEVSMKNTGSPEAQQAFLHGLAQLHNFEYGFAADDFRDAQRIDPNFALAYWGEAMTYTHPIWMEQDKEAALAALDKFAPTPNERQAKAPTEMARDLFKAIDILYGPGTKEEQDDLYMAFMKSLHEKYPKNVEIASFYALSIMGTAHEGREFGLYMKSAALMQNFITQYPRHPGVAHYLIHSTDDPIHAPLGLQAANAYGDIAPNAGHAQHMTTHIFLALGDWDGVIRANIRASGITNKNRETQGLGPAGCGHYPSWLMYGYLQIGERDKAHDIMTLCHKNVIEEPRNYNYFYYAWQRALYLLDTNEWDGDVAQMEAEFGEARNALFVNMIMDGWVALKTNNIGKAKALLASTTKGIEGLDDQEKIVQIKQLEAQILMAEGKDELALNLLRETVAIEMDLPFGFGPPQPPKPSLELLGELLLEKGQLKEAQTVLSRALTRTPNKKRSLKAYDATLN